MRFFVHEVIAGFDAVDLLALAQLRNDRVAFVILVGRLVRGSRDNQRRARFVDQNRINFVNDGEVVTALHASREIKLHVVAQVIEAEFVVRAVGDVGGVSSLALEIVHVVLDTTNLQTEETIDLAHPFRVARGQIIIHGNNVHAAAS